MNDYERLKEEYTKLIKAYTELKDTFLFLVENFDEEKIANINYIELNDALGGY